MKIFFLASVSVDDQLKDSFKMISKTCREQGHEVIDGHLFDHDNSDLKSRSEEYLEERARELMSTLFSCDALIFEGTKASTGGGYYISAALQRQIPVLFLVQKKYTGMYLADQARLLKIERYEPNGEADLAQKMSRFFAFAQKRGLTTRFNMMIDDATEEYLNEASKKLNVSKSDYVRTLINRDMDVRQAKALAE
jgi:hypothetical protein